MLLTGIEIFLDAHTQVQLGSSPDKKKKKNSQKQYVVQYRAPPIRLLAHLSVLCTRSWGWNAEVEYNHKLADGRKLQLHC